MRSKYLAFLAAAILVGTALVFSTSGEAKSDELAVLLPESDGVVVLNSRQLFDQALPQILGANETMLAKVDSEVDKIKAKTGLDLRQFDRVAIGMKTREIEGGNVDLQPVLLARGAYDAATLAEAAKLASEGEMRTEMIGGRKVFVFSARSIVERNAPKAAKSSGFFDQMIAKVLGGLSDEVALAAYDSNTVALGSLERVREMLGNTRRIDGKLLSMLGRKGDTMARFAVVVPDGLSQFLELEKDDLGKSLNSVREVNGSFDVVPGKASLWVAARTADPEQAESLQTVLKGFQGFLPSILLRQKGEDKKVYGRMLENLSIDRNDSELTVSLDVPQSDLDVIVGKK